MKEKIEALLEEECDYLELYLKQNNNFTIRKPNQGGNNNLEFIDDGTILKWVQTNENGCTYKNFIKVSEITFVTGILDCPKLIEDE